MLKDSTAVAMFGAGGKDGVVFIETKTFAKRKTISFLRGASSAFDSLYTSIGNDTSFCYVLNDKILNKIYEVNHYSLERSPLKSLNILNQDELIQRFGINDKKYGILITTDEFVHP